jgi:hypothetical protein
MSKTRWKAVAAVAVMAVSQVGCYTTRVTSGRPAGGPEASERQWFLIGGLANLSAPAGRECTNGVAWTESKQGVVDILIGLALGAGGALVGSLACPGTSGDPALDAAVRTSCATSGASLMTFLLGTRTVTYACASGDASAQAPSWMPAPVSQQVSSSAPAAPEFTSVTQPVSAP